MPSFREDRKRSPAWYEDYLLGNARVFYEAGIEAIKLQDETRERGRASLETVARTAALGRALRGEFPSLALGIIVQAHDPQAALAIAAAIDADFVRLKVFVGAVVSDEGLREGLGAEAIGYRTLLAADHIRILADVHDRSSYPLAAISNEAAALWAKGMGADGLVITGQTFAETLDRIRRARAAGITIPIVIGGSVNAGNVGEALALADAVIVSTSLLRRDAGKDELIRWDLDAARRLVRAAREPKSHQS